MATFLVNTNQFSPEDLLILVESIEQITLAKQMKRTRKQQKRAKYLAKTLNYLDQQYPVRFSRTLSSINTPLNESLGGTIEQKCLQIEQYKLRWRHQKIILRFIPQILSEKIDPSALDVDYEINHMFTTVPAAEALLRNSKTVNIGSVDDSDFNNNQREWVDVPYSKNEAGSDEQSSDNQEDSELKSENGNSSTDDSNGDYIEREFVKVSPVIPSDVKRLNEKDSGKKLALTRIFTDEDFKRINAVNLKKTANNTRKKKIQN
uniref:SDA1 middle domain-containing protein n=1 Tax=Glossina palpalis gambiensis TaxID=67801 RepID=A0A1B0BFY0_9MUSC